MSIFAFLNMTAFYFATILVLITALIFTVLQKHTDRPQNKIFIASAICLIITAMCDIGTMAVTPYCAYFPVARGILEACNYLYFITHTALPVMLHLYAMHATHMYRRFSPIQHLVGLSPVIFGELLVLTNPWTHWVYYFDASYRFCRGWAETVLYVISVGYFLMAMLIFFFRWKAVTPRRKRILMYSLLVTVVGVLLQFFNAAATVELFSESIMFLGIMLSVEYDEDQQDAASGVYNRAAMLLDLRSYFDQRLPFYAVAVQFQNLELVKRLSSVTTQQLVGKIGETLRSVHPRYLIYRATPSAFLLLSLSPDRQKAKELAENVQRCLEEEKKRVGMDIPIRFTVLYASVPTELSEIEDVMLMCESALPDDVSAEPLAGERLQFLFDQAALSEALHRGIAEHNFKIVYQMIYSTKWHRPDAAESLIRLHDSKLGDIYPDAFIPVAERNGMIRQLGEYALREVCAFLKTETPERLGIRFVAVNLSILQCTNPDFVAHASAIVAEYGIEPSRICFEISETAATVDYKLLSETIRRLKAMGFLFSMDRYGAGSANMYSVFSMDFDIVKIDKSMLYEAEKSEEGRIILGSSISLAHELNRRVAILGVETERQISLIREFPVDWIQGNYFATAQTAEELAAHKTI